MNLDQCPDAALVLDGAHTVRLANEAAARHWRCERAQLIGRNAGALLAGLREHRTGTAWEPARQPAACELDDEEGRRLLLRCLPWAGPPPQPQPTTPEAGCRLLLLIDLGPARPVARQRDEALRFLAHDARTPAAAIVGLIELAQARSDGGATAELLQAIEAQARASLRQMAAVVSAARADSRALQLEALDLQALMQQAVDQAWLAGLRRRVGLRLRCAVEQAPIVGDRGLLMDAFESLLADLVEQAPPGADCDCRLDAEGPAFWRLTIAQPNLSEPPRSPSGSQRLLKAAMRRHGAESVLRRAEEGPGCIWTLRFPAAADPAEPTKPQE